MRAGGGCIEKHQIILLVVVRGGGEICITWGVVLEGRRVTLPEKYILILLLGGQSCDIIHMRVGAGAIYRIMTPYYSYL